MNASAMPDARDVNYDMLLSCVRFAPPMVSHRPALEIIDPDLVLGTHPLIDEYYPIWISMVRRPA